MVDVAVSGLANLTAAAVSASSTQTGSGSSGSSSGSGDGDVSVQGASESTQGEGGRTGWLGSGSALRESCAVTGFQESGHGGSVTLYIRS